MSDAITVLYCMLCNSELDVPKLIADAEGMHNCVCEECVHKMRSTKEGFCVVCQTELLGNVPAPAICQDCSKGLPHYVDSEDDCPCAACQLRRGVEAGEIDERWITDPQEG